VPCLALKVLLGSIYYIADSTGPLFVKYNAVLRGFDTEVTFLRNVMIQH